MLNDDKSALVLLVQNSHNVFCYFSVSPITIKDFEDRHGENSWRNSKPVLKVYSVVNGNANVIKTIFIDAFANNWYIKLDKDDMDVFVKLGRVLPDDTFAGFAVSNTVTTPRAHQSGDSAVYFVDISQSISNPEVRPTIFTKEVDKRENHYEPRPYPFMEEKKN